MKNFFSVALVCLAAAFSACTGGASKDDGENVLRLYSLSKIKSIDPTICGGDMYSNRECSLIFDTLLEYHHLKRPFTLIPSLATELPKFSADRKTMTFKIKPGIFFQDDPSFKKTQGKGRELEAQDFVYSIMRVADPANRSDGWWMFDGLIVGLNAWREASEKNKKSDYDQKVAGLTAVDRYTFQVKLTHPSQQALYKFAHAYSSVVPREAVEMYGKDFARNPVGTGPYVLDRKESNPDSKMVYLRNPNFRKEFYPTEGDPGDRELGYLEDAGKPLPFADKVVTTIYIEDQPRWLSFMKGKIDWMVVPKDNYLQAIDPKTKELTEELQKLKVTLQKIVELEITFFAFNTEDPVLKNKKIRQAIALAIDWDRLIELFYNHRVIRAQGPIPPGLAGYDPQYVNPYTGRDLAKSKKFLSDAGFPEGKGIPAIEYFVTESATARQMGEAIAKDLSQIGLKIELKTVTWPEFTKAVKNKKAQSFGMAWSADYPDAENFLQIFYSKNEAPGENTSNYKNPVFDKMYEQSLLMVDGPQRTALYKKMAKIVAEDVPLNFGVHRIWYYMNHPWLKNFKFNEMDHGRTKYFRVDTKLRAEMLAK